MLFCSKNYRFVMNPYSQFFISLLMSIMMLISTQSSGSRNSSRYSRKRYGQPHCLVTQCCHDAASHGPSWLRQENWGRLLRHNQRQEGKLPNIIIVLHFGKKSPLSIIIFHLSFQGINKRPGRKFQVFRVHRGNMSKGERCKIKTSLMSVWAKYQSVSLVCYHAIS